MMSNGRRATRTGIRKEGIPNEAFLSNHNLDETSLPDNWYHAFLSNEKKQNEPLSFCTNDWTTCTNLKATLANVVYKNNIYPTFVTLTCR